MTVHIVCQDYGADRILPRIARYLQAGTGWSLGESPNGRAEANVFIVYIDYAETHHMFRATPLVAWFSHYEPKHTLKKKWWNYAAENVDLRLTCAALYAKRLRKYGPTVQVRPPLERDAYTIGPETGNSVPVVGVSGFVPRKSDRKGQALVAKLYGSEFTGRFKLIATGQGWPVRIQQQRPLAELPNFYRSLDVYLCTSLIEGIPMPPLEALACGVPVVIPRGVGMMDELPNMKGIYRYDKGDFVTMCTALGQALDGRSGVDREALRAVTEPFTVENWARDIKAAVDGLLYDVPKVTAGARSDRRGVYYVAYGGPARACAKHAMKTFKEHMPGVEVALASTEPLGVEDVLVEHPDADVGGRCAKTKIYDLTPPEWEYVLYLDADTEIIADISFLYDVLADGWEFVICKNPGRFHTASNMTRPDNLDECDKTFAIMGTQEVIQLNGGVFGFRRCDRVRDFFHAWHEEWQKWGKRDQAALLRALWRYPLRMYVLGNEFNTVTRYLPAERSAGILHWPQRARRWEGLVPERADSDAAWKAVKQWEAGKR